MGATLFVDGLPRGKHPIQPRRATAWPPIGLLGVLIAAGLLATACSAGSADAGPAGTPVPTPVASSTATPAASGATYTSQSFVVPFQVTVPAWLPVKADQDRPNFLTWERPGLPAVRFLVPVAVYPPGSTETSKPPQDYLSYLLNQAKSGAQFSDQAQTTVGGRPATILTATTGQSLDGSIGCPEAKQTAEDCFGLQPDLSVRLAVVPFDDKVLLVWLRTELGADQKDAAAKLASFQDMLASVNFTGGSPKPSVSSAQSAAVTPVDGVWSASWTYEELKKSPLRYRDGDGELNDENWGTLTLTFSRDKATEEISNSRFKGEDAFTYTVDGDVVTFQRGNEQFVMRWKITGDKLRFVRDDTLGVGPTQYLIKPFVRH
jgi:hypothetical protein